MALGKTREEATSPPRQEEHLSRRPASPQAEVSPGPSPPRTGLGAVSGFPLLCRPRGGQRQLSATWGTVFGDACFQLREARVRAEGPGDPPRAVAARRAVSAQRDVPGHRGGGSLADLAAADLPVGLGCRVQSVSSSGWGGLWIRVATRGAAGAQRGQAGPRSGLPAAVSACGRVRGPGVSPAGSCKGWCVLAERGPAPVGVLVGE